MPVLDFEEEVKPEISIPPVMPERNAVSARISAALQPSMLAVTIALSTPICGVAMKNAPVAPLPAPSSRKAVAMGITPQEQTGNGIPTRTALSTAVKPLPPRCFLTVSGLRKKAITPAAR